MVTLSPFLFTSAAESLGSMLVKAKEIGLIDCFLLGRNGVVVNHLHCAYDTILFCSASR